MLDMQDDSRELRLSLQTVIQQSFEEKNARIRQLEAEVLRLESLLKRQAPVRDMPIYVPMAS